MLSPLIEWDNHNEEAEHLQLEISVPGRAMGRIHPSFFEVATWAHHLESAAGTRRYRLFVDAMVNRIRFEESNPMEILSFVNLVATDTDWKFLEVALTCIPELKKDR